MSKKINVNTLIASVPAGFNLREAPASNEVREALVKLIEASDIPLHKFSKEARKSGNYYHRKLFPSGITGAVIVLKLEDVTKLMEGFGFSISDLRKSIAACQANISDEES